jgi:hypothetical protein
MSEFQTPNHSALSSLTNNFNLTSDSILFSSLVPDLTGGRSLASFEIQPTISTEDNSDEASIQFISEVDSVGVLKTSSLSQLSANHFPHRQLLPTNTINQVVEPEALIQWLTKHQQDTVTGNFNKSLPEDVSILPLSMKPMHQQEDSNGDTSALNAVPTPTTLESSLSSQSIAIPPSIALPPDSSTSSNQLSSSQPQPVSSRNRLPLVGIIDTGFTAQQVDGKYRHLLLGSDYVDGDANPLVSSGSDGKHGNAILNIIAGNLPQLSDSDQVRDASVWLSRAVGSGRWADALIEFVDTAATHQRAQAIANLSFDLTQVNPDGSISTRYELTTQERAALSYAQAQGVLVVVAAGNQNGTISALGQASRQFDNVITVGAADGSERAPYSSYGTGLDLLAVGRADKNTTKGTSIATAKVTKATSEVWAANPGLSYRQVISILKATATDVEAPGWDKESGSGLLNADAAVDLAKITLPILDLPQALGTMGSDLDDIKFTAKERAADVDDNGNTSPPTTPDNDHFSNAIVLNGTSGSVTGSNVEATGETGEAAQSGMLNSTWWQWTASENGVLIVDTMGSDYDTYLSLFTGSSVDQLTALQQNDDSAGTTQSRIEQSVQAGATYYIAVDGYSSSQGSITLNYAFTTEVAPPPLSSPINNHFLDAIVLSGTAGSVTGNNVNATGETGEPTQSGTLNSIWWRWTAPQNGVLTLDTFGSEFDTYLSLSAGDSLDSLSVLQQNDDSHGVAQSHLEQLVEAGTTYYIAVDGYNGAAGNVTLNYAFNDAIAPPLTAPTNDNFTDAILLSGTSGSVSGSNINATGELNEPEQGGDLASVWWSWTAPETGILRFNTNGSDFDTYLSLFEGDSLSNLTALAQDDDSGDGAQSLLQYQVQAGATYYIAVDGYGYGQPDEGNITLNYDFSVADASPPDYFVNAIALTGTSGSVAGSNVDATGEVGEPVQSGALHSIWWSWVAPESGVLTLNTNASDFNTYLSLFTGSRADDLTVLKQNDDGGSGSQSLLQYQVQAGTTYYIAVDGSSNETGNVVLNYDFVAQPDLALVDITLSNTNIGLNQAAGSLIGTFNSIDLPDDTRFTYSLVAGVGDTDNSRFTLMGDRLYSRTRLNDPDQTTYSIRVQTNDGQGGMYEEVFTLQVGSGDSSSGGTSGSGGSTGGGGTSGSGGSTGGGGGTSGSGGSTGGGSELPAPPASWITSLISDPDLLPTFEWYQSKEDEVGIGTQDTQGNLYTLSATPSGDAWQTAVTKYDSNGNVLWFQSTGIDAAHIFYNMRADGQDNLYLSGVKHHPDGWKNFFLVKYDAEGTQQWIRELEQGYYDFGALTVDELGNVYITTEEQATEPLVIKYDQNGNQQWMQRLQPNQGLDVVEGVYVVEGIDVDGEGSVYISGYVYDTHNTSDIFIAKYNNTGHQVWLRQFGSTDLDWVIDITLDKQGNLYLTGGGSGHSFDGVSSTYTSSVYLAKYDSNGNQIWLRQSKEFTPLRIVTDSNDDIYIAGTTFDTKQALVAYYDKQGDLLWKWEFGGEKLDGVYGMMLDKDTLHLTGISQEGSYLTHFGQGAEIQTGWSTKIKLPNKLAIVLNKTEPLLPTDEATVLTEQESLFTEIGDKLLKRKDSDKEELYNLIFEPLDAVLGGLLSKVEQARMTTSDLQAVGEEFKNFIGSSGLSVAELAFVTKLLYGVTEIPELTDDLNNPDFITALIDLGKAYAALEPIVTSDPTEPPLEFFLNTIWQAKSKSELDNGQEQFKTFIEKFEDPIQLLKFETNLLKAIGLSDELQTEKQDAKFISALMQLGGAYAALKPIASSTEEPIDFFLDTLWNLQDIQKGAEQLREFLKDVADPIQMLKFAEKLLKATEEIAELKETKHNPKFLNKLIDFGRVHAILKLSKTTAIENFFLDTFWQAQNEQDLQKGIQEFTEFLTSSYSLGSSWVVGPSDDPFRYTSPALSAFAQLYPDRIDQAGYQLTAHWMHGQGETVRIDNNPYWTNYMTSDNEYTRADGEQNPFLPTVKREIEELIQALPLNQVTAISEAIYPLNFTNGNAPIGYMNLHGASTPGLLIAGSAHKRQTTDEAMSNDNFLVTLNLSYTWIDDVNPNYLATDWREEALVWLGTAISLLEIPRGREEQTLPTNYHLEIRWLSEITYERRNGIDSYSGWPFTANLGLPS